MVDNEGLCPAKSPRVIKPRGLEVGLIAKVCILEGVTSLY